LRARNRRSFWASGKNVVATESRGRFVIDDYNRLIGFGLSLRMRSLRVPIAATLLIAANSCITAHPSQPGRDSVRPRKKSRSCTSIASRYWPGAKTDVSRELSDQSSGWLSALLLHPACGSGPRSETAPFPVGVRWGVVSVPPIIPQRFGDEVTHPNRYCAPESLRKKNTPAP